MENTTAVITGTSPKGVAFTATPAAPRIVYGVLVENKGDMRTFDVVTETGREFFYSVNTKSLSMVVNVRTLEEAIADSVDQ